MRAAHWPPPATRSTPSSEGVLFPKYRADLVACAAVTRAMHDGHIESTRYPRNPLDVLCQQIVAICAHPPVKAGIRKGATAARRSNLGNRKSPSPFLNSVQSPGAPGLAFETWESTDPANFANPASSAGSVAETELAAPQVPVDYLYDLVRSAAPFGGLTRSSFEGVLDLLGRSPLPLRRVCRTPPPSQLGPHPQRESLLSLEGFSPRPPS